MNNIYYKSRQYDVPISNTKYILSEIFRLYKPQEPLTFEPYLHVGMTFKKCNYFLNKRVSSRP